ncbi:unnamed protein product [Rangifer tarandus platyrhynchus]|uniref:Uncharacterized protein n=1 Tax=Rangifer tarandus platyrhynchus TaxID=3082113 RepID=A0ABN8XKH5_RANTA|nr:unnamed protein product [Rangifer tarandus platyrhynchus]
MATPSRLIPAGGHKDGRFSSAQLHQVALLGCGSARRADKHMESDESPRTGVLFLFDVPQRKKWLKLSGASGDCCCSLALHDKLDYAAACFHRTTHQQQAQLLVWRLPSRGGRLSDSGAAAARKKLPPAASTHFFESFVQLLLPVAGFSSTEKRAHPGVHTLDKAADAQAERSKPGQVLVGLSRSSVIAVWGCFRAVSGEATAAPFSIELLLQVDTAHRVCLSPSTVSSKQFSTRPALAAAAHGPGVWYIEEDTSNRMLGEALQPSRRKIRTSEAEGEPSAQESITRKQHELLLRVVRGSYAVPLFASVILPAYSDCHVNGADQQAYLPLLVTSADKCCDGALRPLPAKAITQSVRGDVNEEHFKTDDIAQADGVIAGAERGLPTVSWKRKIGAASSSEAHANTEGSTLGDGQAGGPKARGLASNEQVGGPGAERSSVASILRQALVSSDARLLESVLSSTAKDKKEVAAAVASLAPARALLLLQHLVQQQQNSPATSILKGPWIEELVKQHGVMLGTTEAGREQLVLLLLQVEERRRAEAALVKVKGRVELLVQQMQRIQKLKEQRLRDEVEAREPLVVHREHARS